MRLDRLLARPMLLGIAMIITLAGPAIADDAVDEPEPIFSVGTRPLAVVTAASVNRLKDEAAFVFEAAGAPDTLDAVLGALDENVNGLEGLDWDRPAGIMVFMDGVFPPSFEFVAFLPAAGDAEFQAMMELGPTVMTQTPGEEGRYELITPRSNIQIRMQNEYAYIQLPVMNPDPAFDRDLPHAGSLVAGLINQFDIAVSLDVESIPKGTRDLIYNVLYSTLSTQIQQRDEEPESQYRMRKAWMQADIDGLKLIFDELRRFSIGLDVSVEDAGANIDMVFDVREGSKMLEEIFASTTKPSYFIPLLSEDSPVSLTWSGVMADRDRERYDEVLEALKAELARGIEEDGELGTIPDESSPLFHAISAVQSTAREGHLDVFGQFYSDKSEKLAVVGAMRLEDGEAVAAGLSDLLLRIQGKGDADNIQISALEHAGVTFHRVLIENPDAGARELFGNEAGLTIGCGQRSIWFCLGGEDSFDTLTGVMDSLVTAYENPVDREIPASFRLVVHTTQVIDIVQGADQANRAEREAKAAAEKEEQATDGREKSDERKVAFAQDERRQRRRQRRAEGRATMREALAEGEDRIQFEFRPTDSGMRTRAYFAEGFVRGIGRIIASRFAEN